MTMINSQQREELMAILRQFAAKHASSEEVEYVVELVLEVVSEEEALAHATRLGPVLQEMLEETCLFDAATIAECVKRLVKLLQAEDAASSSPSTAAAAAVQIQEELDRSSARTAKYAPGKFCVAVLEEDQQWHDAKIVDVASELQQQQHRQRHQIVGKRAKPTSSQGDVPDQQVDEDEVDDFLVEVEFFEYGKRQVTKSSEIVLEEDIAESEQASKEDEVQECPGLGKCLMCERMTRLTEHHLIPRMVHAKYLQKGYTKEFLNTTILICRPCHSKIHSVEDEKTLAKHFNTLDTILGHPEIQRWLTFARKQKVRIRPVKKSLRHMW